MAEPEERFTLAGTKLPPQQGLSPTLLYHRWQRYDCFWSDTFVDDRNKTQKLTPFKRDFTGFRFLASVVKEVQELNQKRYELWYERFRDAFGELKIEPIISATTLWRLVVGWGTNPTFETGITLDHLLGFPFIPGSAVKGLVHRVAEQELLEAVEGEPGIPEFPPELPEAPTAELQRSLARALRIRALFGSIHLRRRKKPPTDPESPFDRLHRWHRRMPQRSPEPDPWKDVRKQLTRLCSDTPTGGMVTCFDAVPAKRTFSAERAVLTPDVLTPHPLTPDEGPTPIPFLAVRDGIAFELRYRLTWPASEPRYPEERERAADLGVIDRKTVAAELKRWLVRGLAELGLGGKTSAGYGYLYETQAPEMPELLKGPPVPEAEKFARRHLPEGLFPSSRATALEEALRDPDPANKAAVAVRFKSLFSDSLDEWRRSPKASKRDRAKLVDELAEENEKK